MKSMTCWATHSCDSLMILCGVYAREKYVTVLKKLFLCRKAGKLYR